MQNPVKLEEWELVNITKFRYFIRGRKENGILINTARIAELSKDFKLAKTSGGIEYALGKESENFSRALSDKHYRDKVKNVFHGDGGYY